MRWAAFAAAFFVTAPGWVHAQPLLVDEEASAPSVVLEADIVTADESTGDVIAEGNVEARYQGRLLRAERIIYNTERNTVRAQGRVEIIDPDGTVRFADDIEMDDTLNAGVATNFYSRIPGGGTAAAASAVRRPDGVNELNRIVYTACPVCKDGSPPSWQLRARKATQNPTTDMISYRDVVLQFKGVPVLYLPYLSHPDPSAGAKSGFLMPSIGQNRRLGGYYQQPYYWAISPHQDLTIAPLFSANVNPLLGMKYRKRFWSGAINAEGSVTQEQDFDSTGNRFGEDTTRSHIFATGGFRISDYWDWGFGVARASDDLYLRRYDLDQRSSANSLYLSDLTRLFSHLDLTGQDGRSYSNLSFISAQGLRATDSEANLPLVLPMAEYQRALRDPWFDGQFKLIASTANLLRNDSGVNSGRVSVGGEWVTNQIVGPGILFSPFAQARADVYRVENFPVADNEETFGRGVGLVGFEARMPFVRAGDNVSWMIEPIMMAALGSYGGNDDRIPNEDSQAFELDDSDLFRPNGAPNYDLWEPGPRASLGVRATAITDLGSASALVGRRFRTDEAPEFAEVTNLRDQDSDWVASLSADLGPKLGGGLRLRLSDEELELTRIDASLRSTMGPVSASARYFSVENSLTPGDPTEEIAGTVGVGFAKNWRVSYGVRRDLDSAINLSQSTRLSFQDDCTFLEFVYSRTETEDRSLGPSEGFQIRVGLSTLGVFGGS